ncbi:helix-turn-helix domain-containing protein [Streptomyces sp. NPDC048516]|uniref:helix-turn-helix domain-containing protein n=1 Tax=Streptomyces sp. NPDC048516 TaxID=3365565 RepID=UPI0037240600
MTTVAPHTPPHETRRATGRAETLRSSWEDRSACYNRPTQWWDDDAPKELQEKAREVCMECPVFAECLGDARATEGGADIGRSNVRAGLTGRQRDWLNRQVRLHGEFDAEEARLLALESTVSGRTVKDLAERGGVEGMTLRLAVKLLPVTEVEPAPAPVAEVKPRNKGERVLARMEEVLEWRYEGVSLAEVAARLGVSARTASDAIKKYLGDDPDQPLKVHSRLSKEERAEQITGFCQGGLTWKDIDRELSQSYGTTYRFVARYRSELESRGEPVPREFQRDQAILTEAQVVRIRERAVEGVTDLEQAMELGVNRKVVTDVAAGETYKRFGGPIRPKRVSKQPCLASRTLWHNGQAGFVKAS